MPAIGPCATGVRQALSLGPRGLAADVGWMARSSMEGAREPWLFPAPTTRLWMLTAPRLRAKVLLLSSAPNLLEICR